MRDDTALAYMLIVIAYKLTFIGLIIGCYILRTEISSFFFL